MHSPRRLPFEPPVTAEDVLPHRDALLLVRRVLDADDERIEVVARLDGHHPLAMAQGVPSWIGMEMMAQAVAAFSGVQRRAAGQPVRIGLLLGSRSYVARRAFFPLDADLHVLARLAWRDDSGLGVFDCLLSYEGEELARARIKGFAPDELQPFLQAAIDG